MSNKTQKQKILEHLQAGYSLTQAKAVDKWDCYRLSGRIKELRDEGHNIKTRMIYKDNGKRYGVYRYYDKIIKCQYEDIQKYVYMVRNKYKMCNKGFWLKNGEPVTLDYIKFNEKIFPDGKFVFLIKQSKIEEKQNREVGAYFGFDILELSKIPDKLKKMTKK